MESDTTIEVKRSENEKTSEEATSTGLPPQLRNDELARLEVAVLAAILALALLGNGLVACILRRLMMRQKLTRMNLMIGHLAAADTAVALFNVLPQMAWKITFAFHGGNVACKLVAYGQLAVMYAAAYVLVATAIDRYLAICHPLTTHVWNTYRINLLVASVWIVALMFALPQLFIFAYDERCNASEARTGSSSRGHTSSGLGEKPHHLSSAKLKTVKLTLVVVASYVICYGPYFTVQIWAAWDYNAPYEGPAITIISLLASLNSCVNPLIYMAFNDHVIRRLLSRAFSCCFTRRNGRNNDAHVPPSGDIHRRNNGLVSASSRRAVSGSFAVVRQSYLR